MLYLTVTHSCEGSPHLPVIGFGHLWDAFGLSFLGCPELLKILHYMVRSTMSSEKKKKEKSSMGLNLGVFSSIQHFNHKAFLLGLVEDVYLHCTGLFITEQQPG